jgi:hypothetical protein
MPAINLLTGRVTNAGATITALTMNSGDSETVRSTEGGGNVLLDQAWSQNAAGGVARVRSPRMHDFAQGIRLRVPAGNPRPLLPMQARQVLYSQDKLTIELSGGGAETDTLSLLLYYENLPGITANLATWDQVAPRILNFHGVESNLTTSATAGQYGGEQTLSANFNTLKRNEMYAILGYTLDAEVSNVFFFGPDVGNLKIGGPGIVDPYVTAGWFADMSMLTGRPYIPIIQSANVENTIVGVTAVATGAARNVTWVLAELHG